MGEPSRITVLDMLDALALSDDQRIGVLNACGLAYNYGHAAGDAWGFDRGHAAAEAELLEVWAPVAHQVQALGRPDAVRYSVLAERRGQHERAARAREHEARVMSA